MKKCVIAILALVAMTGCSKNEIVDANYEAISFDGVFVNNATKAVDPSYGEKLLTAFNVYATATGNSGTAVVYSGDEVTGTVGANSIWECKSKTQYWIPEANYTFSALVDVPTDDVTLVANLPASFTYDVTTQRDVLHASATAIGKATGNAPVALTFNHLLAKVKFNFTNAYPAATNFVVKVDNVSITNAAGTGTYTVGGAWAPGADAELSFGPVVAAAETAAKTEGVYMEFGPTYSSNNVKLLVPEKQQWAIKFVANVYYKSGNTYTLVNKFDYSTTPLTTEQELDLQAGHSYNFNIEVGGEFKPITFSATTADWATGADNNITVE